MPHGIRLMDILLYGAIIVAVIAVAVFVIAGLGRSKK